MVASYLLVTVVTTLLTSKPGTNLTTKDLVDLQKFSLVNLLGLTLPQDFYPAQEVACNKMLR